MKHYRRSRELLNSPEGSGDTELVCDVGGLQQGGGPGPLGHNVARAKSGGDGTTSAGEVLALQTKTDRVNILAFLLAITSAFLHASIEPFPGYRRANI